MAKNLIEFLNFICMLVLYSRDIYNTYIFVFYLIRVCTLHAFKLLITHISYIIKLFCKRESAISGHQQYFDFSFTNLVRIHSNFVVNFSGILRINIKMIQFTHSITRCLLTEFITNIYINSYMDVCAPILNMDRIANVVFMTHHNTLIYTRKHI